MLCGGWKCPRRSVAAHGVAVLRAGPARTEPGLPGRACSLKRNVRYHHMCRTMSRVYRRLWAVQGQRGPER